MLLNFCWIFSVSLVDGGTYVWLTILVVTEILILIQLYFRLTAREENKIEHEWREKQSAAQEHGKTGTCNM